MKRTLLMVVPLGLALAAAIGACGPGGGGGQASLIELAQSRGLSPDDAARAIKTFVAPGGRDEYMLFASGGHSGQVHVIGVPSMRLLKSIAVFTPEPWQGGLVRRGARRPRARTARRRRGPRHRRRPPLGRFPSPRAE